MLKNILNKIKRRQPQVNDVYTPNPKCVQCPYGECKIVHGRMICNRSAQEFASGRRQSIYAPNNDSYCIY